MTREEIKKLYEDLGWNNRDLINELKSRLNGGFTESLDGSFVLFHNGNMLVAVSTHVEFFELKTS